MSTGAVIAIVWLLGWAVVANLAYLYDDADEGEAFVAGMLWPLLLCLGTFWLIVQMVVLPARLLRRRPPR